jgi:hypothetical protein
MTSMPRLIRLGSAMALTRAGGGTMHMEEGLPLYYDPV